MAVHLDEEKGAISDSRSTSSLDPKTGVKHRYVVELRHRKEAVADVITQRYLAGKESQEATPDPDSRLGHCFRASDHRCRNRSHRTVVP